MVNRCVREILPNLGDFKEFWKEKGPFRYALTAADYPPVLMEPEEWICGNDLIQVLKCLMGFDRDKMAFVRAPFNAGNKSVLRPEGLSEWKVSHFPEPWNTVSSDFFVPEGHLTVRVLEEVSRLGVDEDTDGISQAFFSLLASHMETMGYTLLIPRGNGKSAAIAAYIAEWEADETEAGLL